MHAIGTAHRCSGCVVNRETHDCRHREIAELVAEYHASEIVLAEPPRERPALRERAANMALRNFVPADEDAGHEANGDDENDFPLDTVMLRSTGKNGSSCRVSKAEQRERKRAAKAQRSVTKALKNEARYPLQVTTEDVERVARILHGNAIDQEGDRHPLATDTTVEDVIDRNLGFVKQIRSHNELLRASVRIGRQEQEDKQRTKRRASEQNEDTEHELVVDAILVKLGVEITSEPVSKKGKTTTRRNTTPMKKRDCGGKARIIVKLREAIKDDLEKHENDLHETYVRAGGFFRYAGKAVFERMTEIARTIDLETGEFWDKKAKREAE